MAVGVGVGMSGGGDRRIRAVALHDPDRQLLQDLPLLENLDEYRQIGSIEFLHRLRDEGLFSEKAAKAAEGIQGISVGGRGNLAAAADRRHEP